MLILEQVRKQGEDKGMKRVLKMIKEETKEMQETQQQFLMQNKRQITGLTLNKDIKLPLGQQEEGKLKSNVITLILQFMMNAVLITRVSTKTNS